MAFVAETTAKRKNGHDMVRVARGNCGFSNAWGGGKLREIVLGALIMKNISVTGKLVGADQLLDQLFDSEARPSIRWLRQQTKAKAIPYIRIGHLVFFDVDMVRTTLETKNLIQGRHLATSHQRANPSLN